MKSIKQSVGFFIFFLFLINTVYSQPGRSLHWSPDGDAYYTVRDGNIIALQLEELAESLLIGEEELTPEGAIEALEIKDFAFTNDQTKVLIFTNSQRVWRYETRGDYWVLDRRDNSLQKLGEGLPEAGLMFAKFSPDGQKVAYVSEHNIYVEDIASHQITKLTSTNGTPKLINGTFDWAYEEEFSCLDGFRWNADSKHIAYWQIDANTIRDFYMINNTDSIYSFTIPVEYPKVGESPSSCRIGVVNIEDQKTEWMKVPGDNRQNYIPRMEWADESRLILQQLNRKQNMSKLYYADAKTGKATLMMEESDPAWISVRSKWKNGNGWHWIENGESFLWITEKDGWRHIYQYDKNGENEQLITAGAYDVIDALHVDEAAGYVYFSASPDNATEKYLYRTPITKEAKPERLTPQNQKGSHTYTFSPNGEYAMHRFSNYFTNPMREWIKVATHHALTDENSIAKSYDPALEEQSNIKFFQVTTDDGVTMDGYMALPYDFDPAKKYPVVFNVYGEPAGQTVVNRWGVGSTGLYSGDMARDGYIYMAVEGRGAPAPKGREWRKSIYRNIGIINIRDQAMACKNIIETYPFIDSSRIAVHGWSGGGSTTLNLLFQYPELYQTGIAVAAVAYQLSYDNIYQERYMGVPWETYDDYIAGSPVTHAKNLKGNLLYIHGTGDDNVHYQNAEMLVNELIKQNKVFQFMAYPNRSHGIWEGQGTRRHLSTLFTDFLKKNCPPGGR